MDQVLKNKVEMPLAKAAKDEAQGQVPLHKYVALSPDRKLRLRARDLRRVTRRVVYEFIRGRSHRVNLTGTSLARRFGRSAVSARLNVPACNGDPGSASGKENVDSVDQSKYVSESGLESELRLDKTVSQPRFVLGDDKGVKDVQVIGVVVAASARDECSESEHGPSRTHLPHAVDRDTKCDEPQRGRPETTVPRVKKPRLPKVTISAVTEDSMDPELYKKALEKVPLITNRNTSLDHVSIKPFVRLFDCRMKWMTSAIPATYDSGASCCFISSSLAHQLASPGDLKPPYHRKYGSIGDCVVRPIHGIRLRMLNDGGKWYDIEFDVLKDEDMPQYQSIVLSYKAGAIMGYFRMLS